MFLWANVVFVYISQNKSELLWTDLNLTGIKQLLFEMKCEPSFAFVEVSTVANLRHRLLDHQMLMFGEVVDRSKYWSNSYLKGKMWKWTGPGVDKNITVSKLQE